MSKVAVVTGANQGLGLALVEALSAELGETAIVYLTARDAARGEAAVALLRAKGHAPVFHRVDVTEPTDVSDFAATLQARHGGVDILISNAAARIDPAVPQASQVRRFINTNNHGWHRVIRAFRPLLRDGSRCIVVASSFGSLRHLPPRLHERFDSESISLEDIESVLDEYASLLEKGAATDAGWPDWINIPSKIGQVASMRILAREMREESVAKGVLIHAVCPGLVDTEASRPWFSDMSSAQAPEAAAQDVMWLALAPPGSRHLYGELIQHRRIVPWS